MKKTLLSLALVLFATASFAEDTPKKPSCAGFVSNGFWSNWEISAGVGAGYALSNGHDLGNKLGFEANLSLLKWIHPVAGLRLQLQGGYFNNTDVVYGKMNWPYVFLHTDVMINASNWIGGYREDRAYYAVPFFGFGYLASDITGRSKAENHTGLRHNFAFSYGVLNKFRVSPSVDINLELKGLLTPAMVCPAYMGGSYLFGFSATAGFTYRFNKRGWQRGVPGQSIESIRALQDAVAASNAAFAASKAEADRLESQLTAARADAARAKAAEAECRKAAAEAASAAPAEAAVSSGTEIYFDYNMSKLSQPEKTRLRLVADQIKNGPKERVYRIEGHADGSTGTAAGNRRIAENRAKNVYDYLVEQGVNPEQLTRQGKGDTANPYTGKVEPNRTVIIR